MRFCLLGASQSDESCPLSDLCLRFPDSWSSEQLSALPMRFKPDPQGCGSSVVVGRFQRFSGECRTVQAFQLRVIVLHPLLWHPQTQIVPTKQLGGRGRRLTINLLAFLFSSFGGTL